MGGVNEAHKRGGVPIRCGAEEAGKAPCEGCDGPVAPTGPAAPDFAAPGTPFEGTFVIPGNANLGLGTTGSLGGCGNELPLDVLGIPPPRFKPLPVCVFALPKTGPALMGCLGGAAPPAPGTPVEPAFFAPAGYMSTQSLNCQRFVYYTRSSAYCRQLFIKRMQWGVTQTSAVRGRLKN